MKDTVSACHIARIDNNKTEGWRVSLQGPVGAKEKICKTFTDVRYQGRNQALAAAQMFRDGLINGLITRGLITRRKSMSGRYAIMLIHRHDVTGATSSVDWTARFPVDGRSKTKRFNLRDYSYEEAWRLAMDERVKHGGLPPPRNPPLMPDWVKQWLLATGNPKRGRRVGVSLISNNGQICWEAIWSVAGHRKRKYWSIRKHGYAGAWALAVEERARHDGLPTPDAPPPMPEWVKQWLLLQSQRRHG